MNVPSEIRHVKIDQRTGISGNALPNGCLGGIYASGAYGTEIVDGEFLNVKLPGIVGPLTYGIYLDGCDGYVIENNKFEGFTNAYLSGGIFVNNSGPGANSIYNNTIKNHQQGIWTQNINYDAANNTGLKMNCNDFLYCRYNIGVQSAYMGPACAGVGCPPLPAQAGGVAKTQGVTFLSEQDNVRNTYNTTTCGNENKFYISTSNNFVVTSHGSFQGSQFHPTPQPSCSNNTELVDIVGISPLNPLKSTYCPSNYYQSFAKPDLLQKVSLTRARIGTLSADFNSKLDGGNTSTLLNLIAGTTPVSEVYDILVAKDFLSDAVLQAFFAKTGLRDSQIQGLFTKNAPANPIVWAQITNLGLNNALHTQLQNLQFNQNILSKREVIKSELTLQRTELGLLQNENVRRFLKENAVANYDSIAAIYTLNELPNSAFKLVDLAIATNRITKAEQLLSALNANVENADICTVLGHIKELQEDPAYAETMRDNATLYLYLKSKLNSTKPLLDTYVKGVLAGVYRERTNEVTLQPEGVDPNWESQGRRGNMEEEQKSVLVESIHDKMIRIYPNPASERLMVENDDALEAVRLEITDLAGKVLMKQDCNKSCELDVSTLKNGVYLLNLYQQTTFLSAKKLVIVK